MREVITPLGENTDMQVLFRRFFLVHGSTPKEVQLQLLYDLFFAFYRTGDLSREDFSILLARWFKRYEQHIAKPMLPHKTVPSFRKIRNHVARSPKKFIRRRIIY
jgi:hypothetical protein